MTWIEWLAIAFQVIATGLATWWGVTFAIKADNKRDIENWDHIKTRLIKGLLAELKKAKEFLNNHHGANFVDILKLETQLLTDTAREQIIYFKTDELIAALSELRKVSNELNVAGKFLIEYLDGQPPHQQSSFDKQKIQAIKSNWSPKRDEAMKQLDGCIGLLEKEVGK